MIFSPIPKLNIPTTNKKALENQGFFRAADGNRTRDLRTTNATHYRLCYSSLPSGRQFFRLPNCIVSQAILLCQYPMRFCQFLTAFRTAVHDFLPRLFLQNDCTAALHLIPDPRPSALAFQSALRIVFSCLTGQQTAYPRSRHRFYESVRPFRLPAPLPWESAHGT